MFVNYVSCPYCRSLPTSISFPWCQRALFCSLMYPKLLEQNMGHSRYCIDICLIKFTFVHWACYIAILHVSPYSVPLNTAYLKRTSCRGVSFSCTYRAFGLPYFYCSHRYSCLSGDQGASWPHSSISQARDVLVSSSRSKTMYVLYFSDPEMKFY